MVLDVIGENVIGFVLLAIAILIAVPCTAHEKGYQGHQVFGWVLYTLLFWPAALVHVLITEGHPERVKARRQKRG